jgi:hypothetical protein
MPHEYSETYQRQKKAAHHSRPQAGCAKAVGQLERRYQEILGKEEASGGLA